MPIPRAAAPDLTLGFLAEGYDFVRERCAQYGSDAFEARLMGTKTVFCVGEDAAQMFYEPGRFTRRGALPTFALKLLQDEGSVATLDGEAHRVRKALFMSFMAPERIDPLARASADGLRERLATWHDGAALHDILREVLCRAACEWVGVPATEDELEAYTHETSAMIDEAGSFGPANWIARVRRNRAEARLRDLVAAARSGESPFFEGSPAAAVVAHRGADGAPLDEAVCAVELLNLIRPIVAVARFVTFAALALHRHPGHAAAIRAAEGGAARRFVEEVRRTTPFFPVVAGRVRTPFTWRERDFAQGEMVVLDLYGTDRDPRLYADPARFDPDRHLGRTPTPFDLVPQGGGDHFTGHRCAGEWLTIAIMQSLVEVLAHASWRVPEQDLTVDLRKMPALPKSGLVLADVAPVR
ncbi:cytochrome P450 [Salinarimonas ramus]|uniref:Cytochrome P450 n=1 Tax=Salinarimonas ramus TaxID=690164 RepID=A0A917QLA7_9HYPH|nr:cytochrome P450 [Salinarimonas ramus]GGK54633.1 cytochrome P450 [Salinarimonas ramus]